MAALMLGSLTYEASFFVGAPGQGYRYSQPTILCALLTAVVAGVGIWRQRMEHSGVLLEPGDESEAATQIAVPPTRRRTC